MKTYAPNLAWAIICALAAFYVESGILVFLFGMISGINIIFAFDNWIMHSEDE